jgi:hypothetical protein
LDRAVFLPDLARDPGAVWALMELLFFQKFFRVARIAVSACLSSTSPHTQEKKRETAFGPSGGDFSLAETGLV